MTPDVQRFAGKPELTEPLGEVPLTSARARGPADLCRGCARRLAGAPTPAGGAPAGPAQPGRRAAADGAVLNLN